MNMSKNEYKKYVKTKVKKSPLFTNMLKAYIIGGIICVIGQIINNLYLNMGFVKETSSTLASITLIFLSALLTSLGLYDRIAKQGGAGTLVPITGFANAVVSPAIEFKDEGYVLGVAANIFKIAGPVITYGTLASVVWGLIYYVAG